MFSFAYCFPPLDPNALTRREIRELENFWKLERTENQAHLSAEDQTRLEELLVLMRKYLFFHGIAGTVEDRKTDEFVTNEILAVSQDNNNYVAKKNGVKIPEVYSFLTTFGFNGLSTTQKMEYLGLIKKLRRSMLGYR